MKKCFKIGIEVPSSVRQAYEIDKKNGKTLWADTIKKEMENVLIFGYLKTARQSPLGISKSGVTWLLTSSRRTYVERLV